MTRAYHAAWRARNRESSSRAAALHEFVAGERFAPVGAVVVTMILGQPIRETVTKRGSRHPFVVTEHGRVPKAEIVAVEFMGERMIHDPKAWALLMGAR